MQSLQKAIKKPNISNEQTKMTMSNNQQQDLLSELQKENRELLLKVQKLQEEKVIILQELVTVVESRTQITDKLTIAYEEKEALVEENARLRDRKAQNVRNNICQQSFTPKKEHTDKNENKTFNSSKNKVNQGRKHDKLCSTPPKYIEKKHLAACTKENTKNNMKENTRQRRDDDSRHSVEKNPNSPPRFQTGLSSRGRYSPNEPLSSPVNLRRSSKILKRSKRDWVSKYETRNVFERLSLSSTRAFENHKFKKVHQLLLI